jgi:hypothetical protein
MFAAFCRNSIFRPLWSSAGAPASPPASGSPACESDKCPMHVPTLVAGDAGEYPPDFHRRGWGSI